MNPTLAALALIGLIACAFAIIAAAVSRCQKAGAAQLSVIGASGSVNKALDPEWTILVNGELWRARSKNSVLIDHADQVIVSEAHGHLLLVERSCDR